MMMANCPRCAREFYANRRGEYCPECWRLFGGPEFDRMSMGRILCDQAKVNVLRPGNREEPAA